MIGFSNLDGLICLCGAAIGRMPFAMSEGGEPSYTVDELAKAVRAVKVSGDRSAKIMSLISDSRRVAPQAAFFAAAGYNTDGNNFVEEAAQRGAVAIVSERPAPAKFFPAAWIQVENIADATSDAAKSFYDKPDEALEIFGITGTNGKTSVSWMIQKMLSDISGKCGLVGTIHYDLGGRCLPASRTTPEALELHALFNQMRHAGCKYAAMEISSHSIAQKRVRGVKIGTACFLNLTQDHLDYHKTMENYFEVKSSLFTGGIGSVPERAVINFDDPHGKKIAERLSRKTKLVSFGINSSDADVRAENLSMDSRSSKFEAVYPDGNRVEIFLNMPGHYNVSNALAALACLYANGFDPQKCSSSLRGFKGVPGRMEKVRGKIDIFVDYAHTDDALKNGLEMLRKVVKGRLLVVFGCGGKRDRTKRPKMVDVVQKYADIAWATSDNPRGEDLKRIFDDMKAGVSDPSRIAFVEDRRRAINLAIDAADKDDCILIAGKGHETFQELGDTIIPFDDKRVAEELLELKGLA